MFDEEYYNLPNQSTIERANTFYFKHLLLADKELDIEFDTDVLGGIALMVYGGGFYIWISFLNNGNDSIVIMDQGKIFTYYVNSNSINIMKTYTNDLNNISFISWLFQKIRSFFA